LSIPADQANNQLDMALKINALKETTEKSDGLRILIARYRPRALPKSKEN
jgi:uncharacterized protein YeaO (DUF488 family)